MGRRPILDDQLAETRAAGELTAHDLVERRATVIALLERTATGVTLCFEGKEVRFPPHASGAVAAAYSVEGPFSVADLPAGGLCSFVAWCARASCARHAR